MKRLILIFLLIPSLCFGADAAKIMGVASDPSGTNNVNKVDAITWGTTAGNATKMNGVACAAAASDSWHTVTVPTISTSWSMTGARSSRQLIPANTSSNSGTKVRITVTPGAGNAEIILAGICVVAGSGDAYDCASTPTQIKWGGNNGVSMTTGNDYLSDETTFTFDKTKNHLITFDTANGSSNYFLYTTSATGFTYYRKNDVSEALTADVTTYSASTSNYWTVKGLEVYGP